MRAGRSSASTMSKSSCAVTLCLDQDLADTNGDSTYLNRHKQSRSEIDCSHVAEIRSPTCSGRGVFREACRLRTRSFSQRLVKAGSLASWSTSVKAGKFITRGGCCTKLGNTAANTL